MQKRSIRARRPVAAEDVERITLSISSQDKGAIERIADERKVSIAWVVRDAISDYLAGPKGKTAKK